MRGRRDAAERDVRCATAQHRARGTRTHTPHDTSVPTSERAQPVWRARLAFWCVVQTRVYFCELSPPAIEYRPVFDLHFHSS